MSGEARPKRGPGAHWAWVCSLMWTCAESGQSRWLWAGAMGPAMEADYQQRRRAESDAAKACGEMVGERGHSGAAAGADFSEGKGSDLIAGSAHALFAARPSRPLTKAQADEALERIESRLLAGLKELGCPWAEPMLADEIHSALRFQNEAAESMGRRRLALSERERLGEEALKASARGPTSRL